MEKAEVEKKEWLRKRKSRPAFAEILKDAAMHGGQNAEALFSRGGCNAVSEARALFCDKARKSYGYRLNEISGYLGITPAAVVRMIPRKKAAEK